MKYLIIGNGVAGTSAAQGIRKTDPEGIITMLTNEAYPFYSRIRLIDYIAGEADEKALIIHKDDWYEKNDITLILNARATSLETIKKEVSINLEDKIKYDMLLIAAGAVSFVPEIKGSDKKGVFTLRNISDAKKINEYASGRGDVIIVGGGLLGLETGNALRKKGHKIKVIEFFERLLPRQMDPGGAGMLKAKMEGMGFGFLLGASIKEITGDEGATGVVLKDGKTASGDMIIISSGVRPDVGLAKAAQIKTGKGISVDDRMMTSAPDVYAAGDCIEHRGICYGIWPAAEAQGRAAGINMAGGNVLYEGTIPSNVLKVAGIDLISAGNIDAEGACPSIVEKDPEKHIYRKLVVENDCLSGCILLGDTKGKGKILKAIEEKKNINSLLEELKTEVG